MDYAAEKENVDMISLLAEFTEMPDHIKLLVLSKLMYKSENKAKEKEEFKNLLSSLSVDLVSPLHCLACIYLFRVQVNNTSVRGYGNLLQDAVVEGKKDFVRILLEFG